jgi:hypothetical protein
MAEKKRIIRVVFGRVKPAFHELSEEEQQEFMRKDRERNEALGYKLRFMIDCSWSNEEWQFIGVEEWPRVEEWPSMNAIKEIEKFYEEVEASKYAERKTYLGTPVYDEYTQSGITNK